MKVGSIGEVRRYPVKSLGGETLQEAEFSAGGLRGDRAWAVRDEVRGGIRGAKKIAGLMALQARYPKEPTGEGSSPAEITLPDGAIFSTEASGANERLSEAVGQSVSLWPLLPADAVEHYRRGAPTHEDMEQELRSVFGRAADEPLPDLSIFPPDIFQFESPPGTYFDAFPLMLMSAASLRSMTGRAPESNFDVRRFRPNLLIDDTDAAKEFPEQEWRGQRLKIGTALLEVTVECPRCVMVTHGFEDLPKDPKVMRSLVRDTGGILGVYAKVDEPGRVAVGDSVELLS